MGGKGSRGAGGRGSDATVAAVVKYTTDAYRWECVSDFPPESLLRAGGTW